MRLYAVNTSTILENFPFLTILRYLDVEYIGIVTDSDSETTSFYPFSESMNKSEKDLFIKLGLTWWWETNRKLPISIALYNSWKPLIKFSTNFITKEVIYIAGRELPSIQKTLFVKTKRKNIKLRKPTTKKIHSNNN